MERNIKLLDCTLRDGAHLNKGHFGKRTIEETIANLVEAKVDIIEVGFLKNENYGDDVTYFSSIEDVKRILPKNKGVSKFSLMADFVDVDDIEPYDGTIDFFRLSFKRNRLDWALSAAKKLMNKGYKCYINPVNCNVYTDEQFLQVLRSVNELKPYGFSIVDTFGVMRKPYLSHLYYLAENNLDPDIAIGIHLHENLGLAYSLAQHFLEIANPVRKISIDGSLLGMGRVPGNLCIEQIMDHLNLQYGKNYSTEPAYDAIDDFIAPIKKEIPWGYSIPYALSGKYGLHRTYAEFLLEKKRLKTKDIQRILRLVDKEHLELFDEEYAEKLYRQYVAVEYDDKNDTKEFSAQISNKKVFVICPGSSLSTHKDEILNALNEKNSITISVNFVPEFILPNFVFCANAKRLNNIDTNIKTSKIITSNLISQAQNNYDLCFSFNNCVYFNEEFCEDSTLMLLKILSNCGCTEVSFIGFDGFSNNGHNYFSIDYTRETGKNIDALKVQKILYSSLEKIKFNFLTPSLYKIKS